MALKLNEVIFIKSSLMAKDSWCLWIILFTNSRRNLFTESFENFVDTEESQNKWVQIPTCFYFPGLPHKVSQTMPLTGAEVYSWKPQVRNEGMHRIVSLWNPEGNPSLWILAAGSPGFPWHVLAQPYFWLCLWMTVSPHLSVSSYKDRTASRWIEGSP